MGKSQETETSQGLHGCGGRATHVAQRTYALKFQVEGVSWWLGGKVVRIQNTTSQRLHLNPAVARCKSLTLISPRALAVAAEETYMAA